MTRAVVGERARRGPLDQCGAGAAAVPHHAGRDERAAVPAGAARAGAADRAGGAVELRAEVAHDGPSAAGFSGSCRPPPVGGAGAGTDCATPSSSAVAPGDVPGAAPAPARVARRRTTWPSVISGSPADCSTGASPDFVLGAPVVHLLDGAAAFGDLDGLGDVVAAAGVVGRGALGRGCWLVMGSPRASSGRGARSVDLAPVAGKGALRTRLSSLHPGPRVLEGGVGLPADGGRRPSLRRSTRARSVPTALHSSRSRASSRVRNSMRLVSSSSRPASSSAFARSASAVSAASSAAASASSAACRASASSRRRFSSAACRASSSLRRRRSSALPDRSGAARFVGRRGPTRAFSGGTTRRCGRCSPSSPCRCRTSAR